MYVCKTDGALKARHGLSALEKKIKEFLLQITKTAKLLLMKGYLELFVYN